jgi:hypothetical protein
MKWKWSKVQEELRKVQKECEERIDYYYSQPQKNDPEQDSPNESCTNLQTQEHNVKDIKE